MNRTLTHPVPQGSASDVDGTYPLAGKRILIIVENLPVPFDRRVWLEATTLVAAGATVFVISPTGVGHEKSYEFLEGIHVYRHPLMSDADGPLGYLMEYSMALFWESWLAWKIMIRFGLDAIHGCNPPDLIFLVAIQFRLLGVRYVFDHHDINPELFHAKFGKSSGFFAGLVKVFERLSFSFASVSIATNQSYRRIAIERGGMPPEDVFVVRSGPDLNRLVPVAPVSDWKNGREFLIGYLGVMGHQEGIDLLLEAASHLVHERGRRDIQFVLVGGGSSLEALKKLCDEMHLDDFVTFTGRVPDAVLVEALSTADICVNPDRVNEMNDKSTMNKIMEYMALGKPVVQFDVTEGRHSALDASLYAIPNDPIDLANKIVRLVDNPALRYEMGEYGMQRVRSELCWAKSVQPLIACYKRLFGET